MTKLFNSIGHFFAWVISKVVPTAEAVATDVAAAASSPLGTAIAQLLGAKGAAVQAGIEAIAGDVLKSFEAAGAAIGASGLNVQFDQVTVAAIEQLYKDLAGLFGKTAAPTAAASTAPSPAAPAAAGK